MYTQSYRYRVYMFLVTIVVFVVALIVLAFSGCNVRKRSAKRACHHGQLAACLEVGRYYEGKANGLFGFLLSHGYTSAEYYLEACKLKSDDACGRMIRMETRSDNARDPYLKDTDIVDALITTCSEEAADPPDSVAACGALFDYMDVYDWAAKRGAQQFEERCNAGGAIACFWVARIHGGDLAGFKNDRDQVIPLYDKACTMGVPLACQGAQSYRRAAAKEAATSGSGGSP